VGAVIAAGTIAAFGEPIGSNLPLAVVAVVAAIVVVAVLAASLAVAVSRRRRKDADDIVLHLEDLRSGKPRTRLEVDPRSPFASIAESANRLGQDLGLRWQKAEAANEGFFALQEAARGYAVIATDADGDLRALSPGAGSMFGWDEDAVVGRNASLLFDEGAWRDLLPKLARKSLRERGVETRALMARKDGTRFHARLLVRVLRGHRDEPSGFLLVVHDVSEQVRVETELRAAESRSRGMLEDLPGGVALVERGLIVYANPAMRSLLGLAEVEAAGFALLTRIATSHVLVVRDALARLEAGGAGETAEAIVALAPTASAVGREVRFVGAAHVHEGRPAVLVTFRDETVERRMARTLAAEEARLDGVLDAWDDAVLLVEDDASGSRVRLANRAFLAMFSLAPAQLSGVTEAELTRLLRERGPEGIAAAGCLAASLSGPAHEELAFAERDFALWATPFESTGGSAHMRMLRVRDVTWDKAALRAHADQTAEWRRRHETAVASYAKLTAMHDALEAQRAEAEKLNAELRTLDGMKSDLLANVSHELQTPLVSIRGYTEMILKGRLGAINDEQKKGLTLSLRNIDRLIAMIDNLLAFARTDRESAVLKLSSFPLSPLVDESLALMAPRIEEKSLHVTRELDDPGMSIRADRDKILQVFLNLLGNAVKFNGESGSIHIEARRGKPGFVVVQIRDSGIGIAKGDLEKVFDRFYQAEPEGSGKKEGSGIGLAIVRNILRLHGCVIHAVSEPGEGTTLSFTLPLAGEHAGTPPVVPQREPDPAPPREPHAPKAAPAPPDEPPAVVERAKPKAPERPRLRIIRR
jgi:PAS domain S-box-containing protein